MIARHSMNLSRTAIVLFGCAVAWNMGVRAPRAVSFEVVEFAGKGRATLVIDELDAGGPVTPADGEPETDGGDGRFDLVEVFATLTFGTEISSFSRGLYVRSSFALPRTGERAVLVVDLDRARDRREWGANETALRARLYTVPEAGSGRFDARPVSGSLELEAAIVGRQAAGFRIRGWLEMRDPGPDGIDDNADDVALEVEVTLESIPTPEEIAGQPAPPPRQPQGGVCVIPWCWADDGYYDGYSYGYGCGDAEVGYDTTSDGCEGDTIDDGTVVVIDDGSTGAPGPDEVDTISGDDGCGSDSTAPDDDPGCEGYDDGSAGDGCDGSDSGSSGCDDSGGSGCSDSGGSSGCASSGCEGDTLERPEGLEEETVPGQGLSRRAGVELVGLGLLLAALATWLSDRPRR